MSLIKPDTKIAIGVPRGKAGFDWIWIKSLLKMFSKYPANYVAISEQAPHASARNRIVKKFLDSDADYLLWIDSDTVWQPDDVEKLMQGIEAGADIVSGLQFATSEHHMPLVRTLDLQLGVFAPITEIPDDENPFEIGGCGFGFVLMKRKVLEDLEFPYFEFKSGFSEDLNFCLKAKLKGFNIFADPRVKLGHINQKIFTVSDFLEIPKSMRETFIYHSMRETNKYLRKNFPNWREDLGINTLQDSFKARKPLSENINTAQYWDKVYQEEVENEMVWRTYPDLHDFIVNNLLKHFPEDARILDIGAGLGILAKKIMDKYPDMKVRAMDISSYAVEYMKELGIDAEIGELPGALALEYVIEENEYDCIIGTEILEHLDDMERKETVENCNDLLADGGVAIFTVPNNSMSPKVVKEHRVVYTKEQFENFLNDTFNGDVEVHEIESRASDLERDDDKQWAVVRYLMGVCTKNE